jgi:hypothetical protein
MVKYKIVIQVPTKLFRNDFFYVSTLIFLWLLLGCPLLLWLKKIKIFAFHKIFSNIKECGKSALSKKTLCLSPPYQASKNINVYFGWVEQSIFLKKHISAFNNRLKNILFYRILSWTYISLERNKMWKEITFNLKK